MQPNLKSALENLEKILASQKDHIEQLNQKNSQLKLENESLTIKVQQISDRCESYKKTSSEVLDEINDYIEELEHIKRNYENN